MNILRLLFPYRSHLEYELKLQREDFTERLNEKKAEIRALRGELAALKTAAEYVAKETLIDPVKSCIVPAVAMAEMDWQSELNRMLQEEEGVDHGI